MEILKLSSQKLKKSSIFYQRLTDVIKKGGLVVFPTDTIYALLSDAANKKSVEKIFKIKKRASQNYLPLFVDSIGTAKRLAKITKEQARFLRKVWPGKVTVVLKRRKGIKLYGVAKSTIALRIPKFSPLNYFLKTLNMPLTATSANISGKPASRNLKEVLNQFINKKNKPDFVVDIGNLPKSKPSTIIDLTKKPPKILRT